MLDSIITTNLHIALLEIKLYITTHYHYYDRYFTLMHAMSTHAIHSKQPVLNNRPQELKSYKQTKQHDTAG